MVTSISRAIVAWALLVAALPGAHAQDAAKPAATVNGVPISQSVLDQALQRALHQGAVDSPELRAAVKSQLIARELFAQEAKKRGLDRDPAVAAAVEEARINAMVTRYLGEAIKPRPVTDDEVRAQYEKIRSTLGPEEYKLRLIVTREKVRAEEALAAARLGRPFAALAQQYSIAPSARRGGELDWVSFKAPATEGETNGLPLVVAQAVEKMKQGDVSEALSFNQQWLIVRLEEKRPTVVPTFEQARPALHNMLAARELERATTELVRALVKDAKITQ
ncbi:MAG: peptidyl-prolyl cis-trans isomerase [Burkholderiales bacterium]|nr:peptidyl-prolyl cis-trans isomerase [Burkholderiales bacterium]